MLYNLCFISLQARNIAVKVEFKESDYGDSPPLKVWVGQVEWVGLSEVGGAGGVGEVGSYFTFVISLSGDIQSSNRRCLHYQGSLSCSLSFTVT